VPGLHEPLQVHQALLDRHQQVHAGPMEQLDEAIGATELQARMAGWLVAILVVRCACMQSDWQAICLPPQTPDPSA
jgi:hypothetical protein